MDIYAQNILDHYRNPRNRGVLAKANASFKSLNASCGDEIEAHIIIEQDELKGLSFEGHGCAIALATSSILSESLLNRNILDILRMDISELQAQLGIEISNRRSKCALISLRSVQGAINRYLEEK